MTKISGKCLCGAVSFNGDVDIKMMANCHCKDCRAATGAAYGTLVFIDPNEIDISGEPKIFKHTADSGANMEKHFCPNCGSQMFGKNSNRPGMISIRAGILDQTDVVKPAVNVYMQSRIASTPIDPNLKAFERMPG
jgi:hypothetical protein